MSTKVFESYYREIFSDLCVSREENDEIKQKFLDANPPPDKLVWLRAAAFRIGSEFLTEDAEKNTALLRCINAIVHAVETTLMVPKVDDSESDDFDQDVVEELYRKVYSDLSVDQEDSQQLYEFFKETHCPPKSKLISTRATAFKIGAEFLSDDNDQNIALLKCINSVVHALEMSCMQPKPYVLQMDVPETTTVKYIGMEASISEAAQHLWDLDVNRLTPGEDYEIYVQGGKKPYWKEDEADDPLFTFVDRKALNRPTYKTFIALLDNYVAQTGVKEKVTRTEKTENWAFLRAIYQSGPMQFCHKYCVANGDDVPSDPEEFLQLLHRIWFDLYSRGRGNAKDSSGFEHVFVGEIKNDKVSGFHNWIYFYLEELKGNVDYRGYIKPKNRNSAATNDDDHILTLQFSWNDVLKNVGTSFIGVSPEFEMALYTMCFLVGQEENIIELDTGTDVFQLACKVYTFARGKIGTSYVEALEHYD